MRRVQFILIASILLGSLCLAVPARAQHAALAPVPGTCTTSQAPASQAKWMMCVPSSGWNGDLVVWGHGYTAFNQPLDFQNLQIGPIFLPDLVQRLGYAFATTSYPKMDWRFWKGSTILLSSSPPSTHNLGTPSL